MDIPIIGVKSATHKTVEVCRSFSRKVNLATYGGPQYESADFFASRKMECAEEDQKWVSQQIFEECVEEVLGSIKSYLQTMHQKIADRERRYEDASVSRPAGHPVRR